jgi:hypothetical protein
MIEDRTRIDEEASRDSEAYGEAFVVGMVEDEEEEFGMVE